MKKIFPNGFKASKLNHFLTTTKVGKTASGLVRETLQSAPFVGTFITNLKESKKISAENWKYYRLLLGCIFGVFVINGIAKAVWNIDQLISIGELLRALNSILQ